MFGGCFQNNVLVWNVFKNKDERTRRAERLWSQQGGAGRKSPTAGAPPGDVLGLKGELQGGSASSWSSGSRPTGTGDCHRCDEEQCPWAQNQHTMEIQHGRRFGLNGLSTFVFVCVVHNKAFHISHIMSEDKSIIPRSGVHSMTHVDLFKLTVSLNVF